MEDEIDIEVVDYFDNASKDNDQPEPRPTQNPMESKDLQFAKPSPTPASIGAPGLTEVTQLITEAIAPLETAINELSQVQSEGAQAIEQANKTTLKAIRDMKESLQQVIDTPDPEGGTDLDTAYNISAFQFQAAMLQPCNGQILPAAVRDEIDRLYKIEKEYEVAKRAAATLNYLLDHTPILLKPPDDPDERSLMLSMLNSWYTQAHPDRPPLKLHSSGYSPARSLATVPNIFKSSSQIIPQ